MLRILTTSSQLEVTHLCNVTNWPSLSKKCRPTPSASGPGTNMSKWGIPGRERSIQDSWNRLSVKKSSVLLASCKDDQGLGCRRRKESAFPPQNGPLSQERRSRVTERRRIQENSPGSGARRSSHLKETQKVVFHLCPVGGTLLPQGSLPGSTGPLEAR